MPRILPWYSSLTYIRVDRAHATKGNFTINRTPGNRQCCQNLARQGTIKIRGPNGVLNLEGPRMRRGTVSGPYRWVSCLVLIWAQGIRLIGS